METMKKKTGNTIKLGIFMTVGVFLFILGIYFIGKRQRLFSRVFTVSGVFRNVSGLQVGNNVRFSGINVGTVDDIEIVNDTSVRVDMVIDEDAHPFIKKDSRAVIGSEGLMGNKTVNISHGTANQPPVSDRGVIPTGQPIDPDEIFARLKTTADNAESISNDLSIIMHNISQGKGTIGKLFMDSSMANTLDQTIINLKRGTRGFEENMDAAKKSFLLRGVFKKKKKKEKDDKG
jgi:phospholipid/cholesterol/gamma-HCH transport system substrate-binding protein